jgi:hypothetical protein
LFAAEITLGLRWVWATFSMPADQVGTFDVASLTCEVSTGRCNDAAVTRSPGKRSK